MLYLFLSSFGCFFLMFLLICSGFTSSCCCFENQNCVFWLLFNSLIFELVFLWRVCFDFFGGFVLLSFLEGLRVR